MGHPFPANTGQDNKRARYNRMMETRAALIAVHVAGGVTPAFAEALVSAMEDHAHAVADRLRDGIEMEDGVTL